MDISTIPSFSKTSLQPPLEEEPRVVNWDHYDFGEGTRRAPGRCWQSFTIAAGQRYLHLGEQRQTREDIDLVGSLREGWMVFDRGASRLVETSVAEHQHEVTQFGLLTPQELFWPLAMTDSFPWWPWAVADKLRGLHLLLVEIDRTVGLVRLDEASIWHLALAFPLLGYLPPDLPLDDWPDSVMHLDVPNIRRVRAAWVEKHERKAREHRAIIAHAMSWVPQQDKEK